MNPVVISSNNVVIVYAVMGNNIARSNMVVKVYAVMGSNESWSNQ